MTRRVELDVASRVDQRTAGAWTLDALANVSMRLVVDVDPDEFDLPERRARWRPTNR